MRFHLVTIFPKIFDSYFSESILKRAQKSGAISIRTHNLRDFAADKHKTTDDTPYGGGAGMVMKVEPIYKCVTDIITGSPDCLITDKIPNAKCQIADNIQSSSPKSEINTRIILLSAKGKKYTQADAHRLGKYENLILICGHYEGVDERVAAHIADEELSIGDYVLTGGELPAMVVVDSVSRLLGGVLGNEESPRNESHSEEGYLEHPQYTKPENFNGWKVPEILLSGNHKEINNWRQQSSQKKSDG